MKKQRPLAKCLVEDWHRIKKYGKGRYHSVSIADPNKPCSTLTSKCWSNEGSVLHWDEPRKFNEAELKIISSFPQDYNFLDIDPGYVMGMSVPPFMTNRLAHQILRQYFGDKVIENPLRTGPWNLTDLKDVKPNGLKVFSCFHCGGGSTMGYKLAGFEVLGGVEIDPEMSKIYVKNHNPKYEYLMGVQKFKNIPDEELPKELFDLDILDGSPPCSSFSMAGSREKKWGTKKKFREGQAEQVLDDLFFDFIGIAKKLQPKVVVAENVKGLIQGAARGYVKQIFKQFREAGYSCQLFLLNSAAMGVPQRRERTFFVANRIGAEKLRLEFGEPIISVSHAISNCKKAWTPKLRKSLADYWHLIEPGKSVASVNQSGNDFGRVKLHPDKPANTQIADLPAMHWSEKRHLNIDESIKIQSFPDDFRVEEKKAHYICGMSVPPFMMQRVADQIYKQWLWPHYREM